MKKLMLVLVVDSSNKCDLCLYDYSYSRSFDYDLIASLMEKTITKAEDSVICLSLRSVFSSELNDTPLAYGAKYNSLPTSVKISPFIDGAHVAQILVCDFSTSQDGKYSKWPTLYSAIDKSVNFNSIKLDSSIADLVASVEDHGTYRVYKDHILYSVSSFDLSKTVVAPSIGNKKYFEKIADDMCLNSKDAYHVRANLYGKEIKTVYTAHYSSISHIGDFDNSSSSTEVTKFSANNFKINIDDKDYLNNACFKVDTHFTQKFGEIIASFYLNEDTCALLDSSLFFIGTFHNIELILFSEDNSIKLPCGKHRFKLREQRFVVDKSDPSQIMIEIHFGSKVQL